ncbi:MAG: membrane protein insertase YidC [Polyangiaceae bacterium]
MDRNAVLRWSLIALIVLAAWKWGPSLFGAKGGDVQALPAETYVNAPGFAPDRVDAPTDGKANEPPVEGETCTIKGNRFETDLSSRGAAVTHYRLTDAKYRESEAADLSTTPDHERWRSLRTTFRAPNAASADEQFAFDRFPWKLERLGDRGCKFTYEDAKVRVVKTIAANDRPFELDVTTDVTNLSDGTKKHVLGIGAYAFRRNHEVTGKLGRVSPFLTELSCTHGKEVTRKGKDDFKTGWFSANDVTRYAAVTNYYFAEALVPMGSSPAPSCSLLAEEWLSPGQAKDDDNAAHVYHAKLAYPERALAPNETAHYEQIAFIGPKEREVLAQAADKKGLGDLINLGFFSFVAKYLVGFLVLLHTHVTTSSWGLSIILLTVCVRLLVFPLAWKSIKVTIGMRKLKPEIDQINATFADDMQRKNVAMMELYRKHGVNPLGGCLPQLVQMPIWFAMWTTLQTAVEMYHTKFLWFTDLSAPDRFYVLPIVLGLLMIVQQKLVPQQGMDPMQQKMMMYMMPAIFTFMMLFLPAALGVYSLTNSVLGILQQLIVEYVAPRSEGKGEIVVKAVSS